MSRDLDRSTAPVRALRWTGSGLIPARGFGYWSAGIAMVVLELGHHALTLRMRPALLARVFAAKTMSATADDGTEIFLVRNGAMYQGIEFRPPRRSSFYFFTRRRDVVLGALVAAGFAVSSEPGRERPVWYQPADD